ncbi:cyclin-like protein [Hyphopichia burtonii NRRL Y-1933]|uniref:RNA polymerase II holoenzyme cyclin-like subunit n=1 Tax=Hyphopichia burtonii NRRL Y-1933 TaxID=984485 RepID=A0A1E4RIU8_9ASCO|nr:cyclin-like protein [Hyphopichia burtonii NRRL Y-1933]ODV67025.1 cyclin-like protein [Hyphopichia burtonii NRRL Y-1933]
MSADFWSSSQRTRWQLTRLNLLESRRKLMILEKKMIQNGFIKDYPNINYDYNMRIYLHTLLVKLGRRLNIRQVALASAEVYLTRFLTRVLLKEINVYLLVTTCIYVACKIEECPQHIRLIISEARNLWPEYIPHDITKLAEFEFYLIEEMESFLFLHHPYKSLMQIRSFLEENYSVYGFRLTNDELQNCWSLINDSYITDLHLLFPPHIIAVASIYITVVLKKNLTALRGGTSGGASSGGGAATGAINSRQDASNTMQIDDLMALANSSNNHPQTTNSTINQPNTQSQDEFDPSHFQDIKLDEDTIKINKFMNFLSHSHINLDEVVESMQDMINLYVVWNRYNENSVRKALQYMLLNR